MNTTPRSVTGPPSLELVPLAAWTHQLAASRPAYVDLARTRLAWALEGLRA